MEDDDDTQQKELISEGMDDDVIPEAPYPPTTKGPLNYFSYLILNKKAATVNRQRQMKEACASFSAVANMDMKTQESDYKDMQGAIILSLPS